MNPGYPAPEPEGLWFDTDVVPDHDPYRPWGPALAEGIPPYADPCPAFDEYGSPTTRVIGAAECHARPRGRRRRARAADLGAAKVVGPIVGAAVALATMVVSLVFWASSSCPLQDLVLSRTSRGMGRIWFVVIYGPWVVAFLSSLLGTFERSRIAHSWVVVVLFSAAATSLCSKSLLGIPSEIIVAGLPPVAAAISFHQFMSQVSALRFPLGRRMHARPS